jgi:hypothetical protein
MLATVMKKTIKRKTISIIGVRSKFSSPLSGAQIFIF